MEGFFVAVGSMVVVVLFQWLPIYLLWNWLMPVLFGLGEVTFMQALGVSILSSMLFKSSDSSQLNK